MNKLRNKRYLIAIAVMLLAIMAFSGCSMVLDFKDNIVSRINKSDTEKAAVQTVQEFFASIIENDYERAYSYVYTESQPNRTFEDFEDEFKDVTSIIKVDEKWIEIKNNIAVVGVDLIDTYDGEEKIYKDIEVSLIKDSADDWKINFWN
jgi:hypothetical protein